MKIHIIGAPGSGKSFLADNLSKQFDIPHYDLDDLQWDNAANAVENDLFCTAPELHKLYEIADLY